MTTNFNQIVFNCLNQYVRISTGCEIYYHLKSYILIATDLNNDPPIMPLFLCSRGVQQGIIVHPILRWDVLFSTQINPGQLCHWLWPRGCGTVMYKLRSPKLEEFLDGFHLYTLDSSRHVNNEFILSHGEAKQAMRLHEEELRYPTLHVSNTILLKLFSKTT